jgi:hypothetical protein
MEVLEGLDYAALVLVVAQDAFVNAPVVFLQRADVVVVRWKGGQYSSEHRVREPCGQAAYHFRLKP